MSPEEASRERAPLPSLPPRRRTGANLIRSNRLSDEGVAEAASEPADEQQKMVAAPPAAEAPSRTAQEPPEAVQESPVPAAAPAPVPDGSPAAAERQPAPPPAQGPVPAVAAEPTESPVAGEEGQAALSRWDQLHRRIFSLADPQMEELVELRKALMQLPARARVLARERDRITESTLVRIGIDLVLRQRDQLHGVTEDELRASLGLGPLKLHHEDPTPPNGPGR